MQLCTLLERLVSDVMRAILHNIRVSAVASTITNTLFYAKTVCFVNIEHETLGNKVWVLKQRN